MSYRDQVDQQMSSLHVNTRKTFTPEWPAIVVSFQRTLRHTHTTLESHMLCRSTKFVPIHDGPNSTLYLNKESYFSGPICLKGDQR